MFNFLQIKQDYFVTYFVILQAVPFLFHLAICCKGCIFLKIGHTDSQYRYEQFSKNTESSFSNIASAE